MSRIDKAIKVKSIFLIDTLILLNSSLSHLVLLKLSLLLLERKIREYFRKVKCRNWNLCLVLAFTSLERIH